MPKRKRNKKKKNRSDFKQARKIQVSKKTQSKLTLSTGTTSTVLSIKEPLIVYGAGDNSVNGLYEPKHLDVDYFGRKGPAPSKEVGDESNDSTPYTDSTSQPNEDESSMKFQIDYHRNDNSDDIPDERLMASGYWVIWRADVFPKQSLYAVNCTQKDRLPINGWIVLKDGTNPAPKLKSLEVPKKSIGKQYEVMSVGDRIQFIRNDHHKKTKDTERKLKSKQLNMIKTQKRVTGKKMNRLMIVSGGQTGVDRAALDVAIAMGIPYRGWIPKGRLAEDGIIDVEKYGNLKECDSADYGVRTLLNVIDSDATLLLNMGTLDGGSLLTKKYAALKDRDLMYIALFRSEETKEEENGDDTNVGDESEGKEQGQDVQMKDQEENEDAVSAVHDYCAHFGFSNGRAQRVAEWIRVADIRVLNVAGPRDSDREGIYKEAALFLKDVLKHFEKGQIPCKSLFGAYDE